MNTCHNAVPESTGAFCRKTGRHVSHGVCRACNGTPAGPPLPEAPTATNAPNTSAPSLYHRPGRNGWETASFPASQPVNGTSHPPATDLRQPQTWARLQTAVRATGHEALMRALDVHLEAVETQTSRTPCWLAARRRLIADAYRNVTGSPFQ